MKPELKQNAQAGYQQPEWVKIILKICEETGAYPANKRYEPENADQT